MASFTDNVDQLTRFNPYVAEQPVEAMAGVGIQREQQFREGVQKVQGYVDGLLGLPIAKSETQQYIKNQVSKLQSNVNQSIAGDFSDQRLTNQIGGLASKIAQDPIVRNGVNSTAAVTAGMADLAEAKKTGKGYSVQNEAYWNKAVSDWQNDGDVNTSFNSTYTPHTDYVDTFLKYYKDMHPGEDIPQDAFRYDENGKKTINPVLFKGVGPDKIQNIWNLVASQPNVQAQLGIDGWYNYRGVTAQQMYHGFTEETNQFIKTNQDAINTMQVKMATDGNANSAELSANIEGLKSAIEAKRSKYNSLVQGLQRNPEGVKARLTEESVMNSLINGYSYTEMQESPLWKTSFEQSKFDIQTKEWQLTYNETIRKNNWDMVMDQAKLALEKTKADKAAKAGKAAEVPTTISNYLETPAAAKGSQSALADRDAAQAQYIQEQRKLAHDLAVDKKPYVLDSNGQWIPNVGPGTDQYPTEGHANQSAQVALKTARDAYIHGDSSNPGVMAQMDGSQRAFENLQNKQKIIDDVNTLYGPQIDKIKSTLPQVSIPYGGKNITSGDLADVWLIREDKPGKDAAMARLTGKFGGNASEIIKESGSSAQPSGGPGGVVLKNGEFKGQYDQVAGAIGKNKDFSTTINQVETEYNKRQTASVSKRVTYDANKPEEVMAMSNAYESILSPMKDLNPSSKKGPVNDMLELLGTDKEHNANHFESWVNSDGQTATLRVSRANETPVTVTIPVSTYYQKFPEQQVADNFQHDYGSKLALNQQRGTGVGRASAIPIIMPSKSPYTVQYHLENTGGGWNIRAWIANKIDKEHPIIGGQILNESLGIPTNMTEAQVLEYVKEMQKPDYIDLMLRVKTSPQQ